LILESGYVEFAYHPREILVNRDDVMSDVSVEQFLGSGWSQNVGSSVVRVARTQQMVCQTHHSLLHHLQVSEVQKVMMSQVWPYFSKVTSQNSIIFDDKHGFATIGDHLPHTEMTEEAADLTPSQNPSEVRVSPVFVSVKVQLSELFVRQLLSIDCFKQIEARSFSLIICFE
jgi:hypothetical protein